MGRLVGIAFLLLGVGMLIGCESKNGNKPADVPQYIYDACLDLARTGCEKVFTCYPNLAPSLFQISSKGECSSYAERACTDSSEEDADCQPVWPSQAEVDACLAEVKVWSCEQFQNDPAGPATCQKISEPCLETKTDGPAEVILDSSVSLPEPSVASCPYTTTSFSCDGACDTLWTLVEQCADDPNLPQNLQTALHVMAGLPKNQAILACKATCKSGSINYPAQWTCFQAAPTDTCTGITGCTLANCPPHDS